MNSGGCISADTEIVLGDDIVTAKELIDGHLEGEGIQPAEREVWQRLCDGSILSFDGFSPVIKNIIAVHKLKSPPELIEIKTSTASLKLTPEHKVLVDKEVPKWIAASELKEGDYVYCPRKIDIRSSVPKGINPDQDFLYLLGMIASDGKISFDNAPRLINELAKSKKWVGVNVTRYSRRFAELAKCFGIDGFARRINFRPIIKLPEDFIAAFLAGFFDGNGDISISHVNGRKKLRIMITYSTSDTKVARQLQLLLRRIGIVARIDSTLRVTFHEDILKFVETIPLRHPKKRKQAAFVKNYLGNYGAKYAKIQNNFYLDKVKQLRKIPANENSVYNLTVADTHCFIPAGGFVISNCNGCAIELLALITPRYDIERFGCLLRPSARHADVLLVSGPVTEQARQRLKTVYQQMAPKKAVIAIGACAISGGPFKKSYNIRTTVDKVIPVSMYVPGCPPRPETIVDGLLKTLRELDGKSR
jgi:Ni,Fe-hydrogenase III small subunit